MVKISSEVVKILQTGGVGVLPTDTLYGLVGSALNKKAVQKIYKLKRRSPGKPFIILISKTSDLKLFGIRISTRSALVRDLKRFWPGPISIILECPNLDNKMSYLKPLDKTLAFRCPNVKWLNVLLNKAGPLVAPTANPEGLPLSQDIGQAEKYFASKVDFYVDTGTLKGKPSKIIKVENGKVKIIRR